jgi:hypothetical protein
MIQKEKGNKIMDKTTKNKKNEDLTKKYHLVKPFIKGNYNCVRLNANGKDKIFRVCYLVAEHFLKKEEGKEYIWHINGNLLDDRAENLKYVSHDELMTLKQQQKEKKLGK